MATKRGRSRIARVLRAGLLLVLLPLVVAVCLIVFEIPLNLSPFRPRLQALASKSLKRDVALEGSVRVTLRRSPAAEIEMENVRISGKDPEVNPSLLDAGRIEAGVWLPPLR